jgi:hypothetical protein
MIFFARTTFDTKGDGYVRVCGSLPPPALEHLVPSVQSMRSPAHPRLCFVMACPTLLPIPPSIPHCCSFENHIAYDHNMWAYVNFLVHIRYAAAVPVLAVNAVLAWAHPREVMPCPSVLPLRALIRRAHPACVAPLAVCRWCATV